MKIVKEDLPTKKAIQKGTITEKLLPFLRDLKLGGKDCLVIVQSDFPKNNLQSVQYFVVTGCYQFLGDVNYRFTHRLTKDKNDNITEIKVWKIAGKRSMRSGPAKAKKKKK